MSLAGADLGVVGMAGVALLCRPGRNSLLERVLRRCFGGDRGCVGGWTCCWFGGWWLLGLPGCGISNDATLSLVLGMLAAFGKFKPILAELESISSEAMSSPLDLQCLRTSRLHLMIQLDTYYVYGILTPITIGPWVNPCHRIAQQPHIIQCGHVGHRCLIQRSFWKAWGSWNVGECPRERLSGSLV